jgi:hypothetical protein
MISNYLNRPNNSIINHLGAGSYWRPLPQLSSNLVTQSALNFIFLERYFKIIFKSGIVYSNHLFYNSFYFFKFYMLSIPVYMTEDNLYRFYQIKRFKGAHKKKKKKEFLVRKFLHFINFSKMSLYRYGSWVLISFFIYLPEILKRLSFESNTQLSQKTTLGIKANNASSFYLKNTWFFIYLCKTDFYLKP